MDDKEFNAIRIDLVRVIEKLDFIHEKITDLKHRERLIQEDLIRKSEEIKENNSQCVILNKEIAFLTEAVKEVENEIAQHRDIAEKINSIEKLWKYIKILGAALGAIITFVLSIWQFK